MILEYALVVSAVAVGWSGYAAPLLQHYAGVPLQLMQGPDLGGIINLPAVSIIWLVAGLLCLGTRESAAVNALLVLIKLSALLVFSVTAFGYFDPGNLTPFMPFGFSKSLAADGSEHGVMAAAAIIFFAFYGFDTIASAAEESHNPNRDLAIGIVGSMLVCILIYIIVAVAALGATPYTAFADSPEPLALILRSLGQASTAQFMGAAAVMALPTVILAFFYGQSRIFFAMARDGLLPAPLAKISRYGTPQRSTMLTAILVSAVAGVFPLADIAALANAGTLIAFMAVAVCMLVMRRRQPQTILKFKTPWAWFTGPFAICGCLYLFYSLPQQTQAYFGLWNLLGLLVYAGYNSKRGLGRPGSNV